MKRILGVAIVLFGVVSGADAQLRGLGHVEGRIVDDRGVALPGVTVTATLSSAGGSLTGTSDTKGTWKVIGMARGRWDIAFQKPGFAPSRASVEIEHELARLPSVTIRMKSLER